MNTRALSTAIAALALTFNAAAIADGAHKFSNKWRIEVQGEAQQTGNLLFRVTPNQGEPVDITVALKAGRNENNVAKDVRDALQNKLSPLRYDIEADDGEDVLVKREENQPKFSLELVRTDVPSVAVHIESE
jgi:hypothetical protein